MASSKKTTAKQTRTLRQTTEDKANTKKRRLREPVGKIGRPLKKASSAVGKSKVGRAGRFLVPKYFRNSWRELKEVTWPNRKQTVKLTFAVIAFATVFGIVIALIDFLLDKVFRQLFL